MEPNSEESLPIPLKKELNQRPGLLSAFLGLFRGCSILDKVLLVIGILAAIGAGTIFPLVVLNWGQLANAFLAFARHEVAGKDLTRETNDKALRMVYYFIAKFAATYIYMVLLTITSSRIAQRIRLAQVSTLLQKPISYFDAVDPSTKANKGSIAASMDQINAIEQGCGEKLGLTLQFASTTVTAIIISFDRSWRLTLVTGVIIPLTGVVVGLAVFAEADLDSKIMKIYASANSLAAEVFSSIRDTVAYGTQSKIAGKYDTYLREAYALGIKKAPAIGAQYAFDSFFPFCGYALAFWYGFILYRKGEIPGPGEIITVFFCVLISGNSMTSLSLQLPIIGKAASAAVLLHVDEINSMPERVNAGDSNELVFKGDIELRNIKFCYPTRPSTVVLELPRLWIPRGKKTVIVGPSGSGKSTIVGIMQRWYPIDQGVVSIGGRSIEEFEVQYLRKKIGLVQQDVRLFNASIHTNVAHGLVGTPQENVSQSEQRRLVIEACKASHAHAFIMDLPHGYDTELGESAKTISGGQKQRLAIARAIISNPDILILDEATAALDSESKQSVRHALSDVCQHRTTISITHDFTDTLDADQIVVISNGRVVESGNPEQLINSDGWYSTLSRISQRTVENNSAIEYDTSLRETRSSIKSIRTTDLDYSSRNSSQKAPIGTNGDVLEMETIDTKSKATSHIRSQGNVEGNVTERFQEHFEPTSSSSSLTAYYALFKEQKAEWPWMLVAFFPCIVGGFVQAAKAILFGQLVGAFLRPIDNGQSRADFLSIWLFVLGVVTLIIYSLMGFNGTVLAQHLNKTYRAQYFRDLVRQDIAFFDDSTNTSASLVSRLSAHPTQLQGLLSTGLGLILIMIVNIASCSVLALVRGWRLGLVGVFVVLPPICIAGGIRLRLQSRFEKAIARIYAQSAQFSQEAVLAMRTVKALTIERTIYEGYQVQLDKALLRIWRHAAFSMIVGALAESLEICGMALAFWYGSHLLANGDYTLTQFFTIFAAVVFGGQATSSLLSFSSNFTQSWDAAAEIINMHEKAVPINNSKGSLAVPGDVAVEPAVRYENVYFSYPSRSDKPVLKGVTCNVQKGHRVAFVGTSGCGKTTILSLLQRFYDPDEGTIFVGGTPLRSLDVTKHRKNMALVPQDPTLYEGTIRENICLGLDGPVEEERLVKACKDAFIYDFIMSLPEGFETECGQQGTTFSGGQRQRIAIAKALIRAPALLLLDESTSALDFESEKIISEALDNGVEGTVLIVAHRRSTIEKCDVVYVLDRGVIVESGTPKELSAKRGMYHQVVMAGIDS
ncbi:ABC multidrug transporter Mdr1 [Rhizodiscina lignyota]|uniref:ABC multidrug transporter Mdr1 n=1 Tax=Rhizodiscina lignyota TaxID=1504668 RepID=A0A9P4M5G4_9PEZI|nr:ABC multidrug transporter Mdr1 [Rhizodiscina lignyota]